VLSVTQRAAGTWLRTHAVADSAVDKFLTRAWPKITGMKGAAAEGVVTWKVARPRGGMHA
jgi:hypothetical protein